MDAKHRTPWSLDEYIVVADLYLERRRSSNARDPEVVNLARLTGRTEASISRRLGNFHGTAVEGAGLKPVTGAALEVFAAMAANSNERVRLAVEAHRRLSAGLPSGVVQLPSAGVRTVSPEQMLITQTQAQIAATVQDIERSEARLVDRYIQWSDPDGDRLVSVLIPAGRRSTLRVDLFDPQRKLLIEAKAHSTRENVRYAIGQLLDYRRYIQPRPALAVLLPDAPDAAMTGLLTELKISMIWPEGRGFTEHA